MRSLYPKVYHTRPSIGRGRLQLKHVDPRSPGAGGRRGGPHIPGVTGRGSGPYDDESRRGRIRRRTGASEIAYAAFSWLAG